MTASWSGPHRVQPNTSMFRAIDRGQWQAPLGSSRGQPPHRRQPAAVLASVKDKPFGRAEEAAPLAAAARDGDGNMRSGRKNARGAGRTKEWNAKDDQNGVTPLDNESPIQAGCGKSACPGSMSGV